LAPYSIKHLAQRKKRKKTITMSETNTNPFEDRSTDTDSDHDNKEQNTITDTNPFDDPAMNLDSIDPDPEEQQQTTTTPKTSTNPFDDPTNTSTSTKKGTAPMGDNKKKKNHDRYDGDDGEDDSVQSMLEMMETKNDPNNKYLVNNNNNINRSLQSKARGSLAKWRWRSPPSILGGMSDDDKSLASYDFIALSSLKNMLRNEDTATSISSVVENDDDDEESLRSKPTSVRSGDDDVKSDGTTSTKNTGNRSDAGLQQSQSPLRGRRRMKYIILLASFLAILLLLGILVLSYSLYALRNEEDEDLSVFTRNFWNEELSKTLAFWKEDENEGEQ
jgi:hypothetical protein